jgi:CheY-like chemotaxis protein
MKQVLIIDESPFFQKYLRLTLEKKGVGLTYAKNCREGITSMKKTIPDIIVLDYDSCHLGFMELLKQKTKDEHLARTSIIILAHHIKQAQLVNLIPYHITTIINKPIQLDSFIGAISDLLGIERSTDINPCNIEAHVNDNIVFIEISNGLNLDKLELLRFKIKELLGIYSIISPKIITILKDINIKPADEEKLSTLFNIVLQTSRARQENVKVMADDDFIRKYLSKKDEFRNIEVFSDLQHVMNSFNDPLGSTPVIVNTKDTNMESNISLIHELKIAVIDDDFVIHSLIKSIFEKTKSEVTAFSDGDEFLMAVDFWDFDLVFLDLHMPKVNGFEVINALNRRNLQHPVIVLSANSQQDIVIRAMQMGVKSYIVKPFKPENVLKKSIEILKLNF